MPAPTPHKGGNTIELPPWKKGWHRPMAPQYARHHFMQQQGAAQVCGLTLCSAVSWIDIFLQQYLGSGTAKSGAKMCRSLDAAYSNALHIPVPQACAASFVSSVN